MSKLRRRLIRVIEGRRRAAIGLLFALPALLVLAFDLGRRGAHLGRLGGWGTASYAASLAASGLLWGSLLALASARRGALRHLAAGLLVVATTVALGSQRYFYDQYATYLNLDAMLFGLSFGETVAKLLRADLPAFLRAHASPLLASIALVALGRYLEVPTPGALRAARLLSPLLAALVLFAPWAYRGLQASTPDVIYLHAAGGLAKQRLGLAPRASQLLPGARSPEYIPALAARPRAERNVVFVLTESVRADVVCGAYDPGCKATPFSNRLAPGRLPLLQMRANDSTTAVSVAVLLTGASPTQSRDDLHRAPMAWEFARAAGWDTAYWTSQDLRFGNSDMFVRDIGAQHRVAGADLDPDADLDIGADDARLTEHVASHLTDLREPFFAVVHYSNTHFPYLVDPQRSPFQPSEFTKDPDQNEAFFNHYRNAVYLQDEAVGRLIETVRSSPFGPRTVIVYTSDHGEAFREHAQLGHTVSIYDEEIHVPFWVDAPPGTLADTERTALVALRDRPVFHTDALPTFLDLMGSWDLPEVARFRSKLIGESLLRAERAERPVPITNCAALWTCPFKNWGLMRGPLKLEARQWDPGWHCWDVLRDPGERNDLGAAACGELSLEAQGLFGASPGGS